MLRRTFLAQGLAIVGVGVTGFRSLTFAQDATPAAAAPTGDPIVIGAAIHQSGWMAAYDLPTLASMELAILISCQTPFCRM